MAGPSRERRPGAADPGRRNFLKQAGAAGACVTLPPFLGGCGVLPALEAVTQEPAGRLADWFALDERDLSKVLAELGARGGDFGEVFFQQARRTRLLLEDGRPQPAFAELEQGAGLRVVHGERSGFAHVADLTRDSLAAAAREAAERGSGPALARPSALERRAAAGIYPVALPWADVAAADKWAIIARVEERALAADPAIDGVRVEWRDSDERILIASLDGRLVEDRRPLTSLSVQVSASRGGVTHSGFASMSARAAITWYSDARLDELAATAAARALIRFEARRPPAGELPVILAAGTSGILLHEAVGHVLEGDFHGGAAKLFAGRPGERVASKAVTLVDDATIAHARGALAVDDEGSATGRTVLIEEGVLRTRLQDRRSARRAGGSGTASARRESFRYAPLPRMTCTYLADGPHSADDLLAAVKLGVLAETFAGGRADPDSGDFTFTILNGWLIENGVRTMPIRDVPLSGNGAALMSGIERVAGDGRLGADSWTCGKRGQRVPVSLGMPTTLVSGLTVGVPDTARGPDGAGSPVPTRARPAPAGASPRLPDAVAASPDPCAEMPTPS